MCALQSTASPTGTCPKEEKEVPFMNGLEALQVQINTVLGELIHVGSSMSSTIAYGMGMF